MTEIRFGTDGWRGVIARDFTFDNLSVVTQATVDYLRKEGLDQRPLVIGYDRRFLSREFARHVASIAAGNGIRVLFADRVTPTPILSWSVRDEGAGAGVMITASHNPPEYNGFKIKESFGGSARPSTTRAIEETVARNRSSGRRIESIPFAEGVSSGRITLFDPFPSYLDQLERFVDLEAIRAARLTVALDPMHGAGSGVLSRLIDGVTEIHDEENPGFGGVPPEPTPDHLKELGDVVRQGKFHVGLALDGDADRIGAVDENGEFFSSHMIFTVVLKHLVERRGMRGGVVKTVSTTRMVDALCERYGLPLHETPIGFKHICELMLPGGILMGGEESGGIGIASHLPERDGVLLALLLLETVALTGKGLRRQLDDIMAEIGHFSYRRIDLSIDDARKRALIATLTDRLPADIDGIPVVGTNVSDGFKFLFADGSWLLIRPSGTEPVLRLYAEASGERLVERLLTAARAITGC